MCAVFSTAENEDASISFEDFLDMASGALFTLPAGLASLQAAEQLHIKGNIDLLQTTTFRYICAQQRANPQRKPPSDCIRMRSGEVLVKEYQLRNSGSPIGMISTWSAL